MSQDYSLLAPGPVNLHPEVRRLLALPMIHHRTPEFDAILSRSWQGLKKVFGTEEPVFILSSTGSGGMEALLVNVLHPGDQVLAVISGKFGERWAKMAEVFGGQVTPLNVPWGQAVTPEQISEQLQRHPGIKILLCQACETSTGVLHPIAEIAKLLKEKHPEVLFLVDGITAVGALPLPMDQLGLDGLVAGSQKAFMLPTGLSFVSLSARAWARVEKNPTPRFYFDLRLERAANQKGESLFSSSVPLIRALDWILQEILSKGLPQLYRQIERRSQMTHEFLRLSGLKSFAKNPSPSLTAIELPAGVEGQKLRERLEHQHGLTVMGGQDQAKGKILRIGHMGHIEDREMLKFFSALSQELVALSAPGWTAELKQKLESELRTWAESHP